MSLRIATNTVEAVLRRYEEDLTPLHSRGEVRAIARAVFQERLGRDTTDLLVDREAALSESELLAVYLPLKRLRAGEPLQYVLGHAGFHGLRIAVDPSVLIPRPETEELVELIIRSHAEGPRRILDIGTGSGCIALALKKAFPDAEVHGVDVSSAALITAGRNAQANGLSVIFEKLDILDPTTALDACDLIVSNPPYVPRGEEASLTPHVRDHEPHLALFVEDGDPLRFYRAIAHHAWRSLATGGELWFEGHHLHTPDVGGLLLDLGFSDVQVLKDMSGAHRFISARR